MIQSAATTFPSRNKLDIEFDDYASFGRFCDRDDPFHVLVQEGSLTDHDNRCQRRRFPPGTPQPEAFPIGELRVVLVVHRGNPVPALDLAAIGKALGDEGKDFRWRDAGGAAVALRCYGPLENAWARKLVQDKCMTRWEDAETPGVRRLRRAAFRPDLAPCADAKEIIAKVRADPGGLGFFAWDEKLAEADLRGVRVVPVAAGDGGPAVAPALGPMVQNDYPLAEPVVLYVHPDAPPLAREFSAFCAGPEGASIAAARGLVTAYRQQQFLAEQRLADYKAGKGTPVAVCGLAGREDLVKALAVEYVKAKALVQVTYEGRATAEEAEAAFGEKGEVLMKEVGSGQSSVVRGQLSVVSGAKQLTTDHGQLTTYPLGHRAVGVIVHRDSAVKELTLDDLRGIYSGQIDAWPGASGKDAKMGLYGLAAETVTMKVLAEVVRGPLSVVRGKTEGGGQKAESGRHARITRRDDTAKVVQAVAGEPGAIGFVDLAAMPAKESSVKLVAILADGAKKTAVPTPDSLPEGYPLAQPVALSVHARASETARDFAAFIGAHGPEVQESLRASGIVPEKVGRGQSAVGSEGSGGQRAEGLGAVALGQFDEGESGGEKAEQAALTPGPSPGGGVGRHALIPGSSPATAAWDPGRGEQEVGSSGGATPHLATDAPDLRPVAGAILIAAAAALGLLALHLARR